MQHNREHSSRRNPSQQFSSHHSRRTEIELKEFDKPVVDIEQPKKKLERIRQRDTINAQKDIHEENFAGDTKDEGVE